MILSLVAPPTSLAFIYIKGGVYNKGARPVANAPAWSGRSVTFKVNPDQNAYGGSNSEDITSSEFIQAVKDAIDSWSDACASDLTVNYGGTTSSTDSTSDYENTITWDDRTTGEGNTYGASTGTLAAAFSVISSGDEVYDCDIIVNGNFSGTFGVDGSASVYDIVSTLAHEVGHCLGLDHPVEPPTYTSTNSYLLYSTMVQTAVAGIGSTFRRTINQDDIDGIDCIYQSGTSLRSGGVSCDSYHGTNGGSDLTGTVSGGPSADRSLDCGSNPGITVYATGEKGSGCISKAVAAEPGSPPIQGPGPLESGWLFFLGCFGLAWGGLRFKSMRRWREEDK